MPLQRQALRYPPLSPARLWFAVAYENRGMDSICLSVSVGLPEYGVMFDGYTYLIILNVCHNVIYRLIQLGRQDYHVRFCRISLVLVLRHAVEFYAPSKRDASVSAAHCCSSQLRKGQIRSQNRIEARRQDTRNYRQRGNYRRDYNGIYMLILLDLRSACHDRIDFCMASRCKG